MQSKPECHSSLPSIVRASREPSASPARVDETVQSLAGHIAMAVWRQIDEQAFSSWRCPPNLELGDTARFDLLLGLLWIALAEEHGEREGRATWSRVLHTFAEEHMEAELEAGAEAAFFEAAELLRSHWQVAPDGNPLEAALRLTARDAYLLPDGAVRETTLRAVVADLVDDAAWFLADIQRVIADRDA